MGREQALELNKDFYLILRFFFFFFPSQLVITQILLVMNNKNFSQTMHFYEPNPFKIKWNKTTNHSLYLN